MMENKIGYAYISLEDYKELIEENKNLENENEKLENEINDLTRIYASVENTICEKIYNNEKYYLENFDGIGGYHYNELVEIFQRHGYSSLDKIDELIGMLVARYKKEGKTKDEK